MDNKHNSKLKLINKHEETGHTVLKFHIIKLQNTGIHMLLFYHMKQQFLKTCADF